MPFSVYWLTDTKGTLEMIVAFDASVLMYLLDEKTAAPPGEDGLAVPEC
jgi:hypothetical protein